MSQDAGAYSTPVDFWLAKAMEDIMDNYRHKVSVARKSKDLLKFGESTQVGTSNSTLMDLPSGTINETYLATNGITHISSSSGSDTVELKVEGHTIADGVFTFVVQTVTLAGQTKTALTTPLARCTRIYNNDSTDLVGNVYAYEDDTVVAGVPQTGAKVHCMISAGKNNSNKASTTISDSDYWILTGITGLFLEKAAGYAEIHLEIREKGKVFREYSHLVVNDGNGIAKIDFKPYLIIKPNSDVRLTAVADGASTYVGGEIQGVLAKIV